MATKLFPVVLVIGLTFCVARVQSQLLTGTPTESPTLPKHPTHNTSQTTSRAESTTSASEAESPAASPKPKRTHRKATAEASPSPTPTPVPSPTPRKFRFPRLFKPKRSASPTPVGMNSGPATGEAALRQWSMLPLRLAHRVSDNSSAVLELFDDSNAMRAPGCSSKLGHQHCATSTAAKRLIPADDLRWDRSFRLVSACPQSIKWSGAFSPSALGVVSPR